MLLIKFDQDWPVDWSFPKLFFFKYLQNKVKLVLKVNQQFALNIYRVGSHVVSVRIHCTEKWWTSFHTDVLSKSK